MALHRSRRTNGALRTAGQSGQRRARRRSAVIPLLAVVALAAPRAASAQGRTAAPPGTDSLPVDRWLVSTPFAADSSGDPLAAERLGSPGAPGVLPVREGEEAGAAWRLARRDGSAELPLDSAIAGDDERPARSVVFAHSYIRFPEDRTVLLSWSGDGCTPARAWLNGRPLSGPRPEEADARGDRVRMAAGWNTLLLEAVQGECPFRVHAALLRDGPEGTDLGGVSVQASRPPGDVRTGPAPWVLLDPSIARAGGLAWRGDRLLGGVRVTLVAWGLVPLDRVEVKGKAAGQEDRATLEWLTPGQPTPVSLFFPLDRLERASGSGPMLELELRFADTQRKVALPVAGVPAIVPDESAAILLEWKTNGDDVDLPVEAGQVVSGEWKVPEALAGRDLVLDTSAAPAAWTVNGSAATDSEIQLCTRCGKGETIQLAARASDRWEAWPKVRIQGGR